MGRARRGRGEASVYQRSDGTWCGSVSLGFAGDGKRRRRTFYGPTKRDVLDKIDRFRQDVRTGLGTTAARLTLGQFLDFWLDTDKTAATADQARAILAAAAGNRLEAIFAVIVATGMRQGEAFALRWQDVDFEKRQLHVRHSLEELDGVLRLKEPKSAKSRRTIELAEMAVAALLAHRDRMKAEGFYGPLKPVFCDTDGGFLRKSNFTRNVYNPIRVAAGLPGLGLHQWRHCHATLLVELGTDARVIQERLGHADVGTTLRFYVHPRQESHRKAADAFDATFREPKKPDS